MMARVGASFAGVLAALVLLLAACARVEGQSVGILEKYLLDNGGKLRTVVKTNKDGIRALFAKEDIKSGEPVATIPSACIINVGHVGGSFLTPTLTMLRELRHPASRFKPYLATLPTRDVIVNACNMDKSLWPLFESEYWSKFAESWQGFLESAYNGTANAHMEWTIPEVLGDVKDTLTLDDLKYACALTATRYVGSGGRRNRLLMIPIFDLANHYRGCNSSLRGTDDNVDEVSFVAGRDYKAGEEICNSYGNLLADYALVHYGFVYREDPPRLLLVDHHQFNPSVNHQHYTEELFVATSQEAVNAELARLKTIQATLQQYDREAAKTKSRPKKGTNPVADSLLDLQAYRREAIDYEIKRLSKVKF